jgi:Flp pilus assembly protein TadD
MRYLSSISLALVVLMALACTATPAATPTPVPEASKNTQLETRPWLYRLDEDQMVRIEVSSAGHTVRYEKKPVTITDLPKVDSEDWYIQENSNEISLGRGFNGAPLLVSGPRAQRVLADNIDDPASYGLEPPETKLLVVGRVGGSVEVHLGIPAQYKDEIYVRLVGRPELLTVHALWVKAVTSLATDPPYSSTIERPTPTHVPTTPTAKSTLTPNEKHFKATGHWMRGYEYLNNGQYQLAIDELDIGIQLEPDFIGLYSNRGVAYARLGRYERAIKDYDESIRRHPNVVKTFHNRGVSFYSLGQYQRAIQDFDKALEPGAWTATLSEKTDVFLSRGNSYYKLGQYQNAVHDYNKAVELAPDDARAYSNRGNIYKELGRFSDADADQATACSLDSSLC